MITSDQCADLLAGPLGEEIDEWGKSPCQADALAVVLGGGHVGERLGGNFCHAALGARVQQRDQALQAAALAYGAEELFRG